MIIPLPDQLTLILISFNLFHTSSVEIISKKIPHFTQKLIHRHALWCVMTHHNAAHNIQLSTNKEYIETIITTESVVAYLPAEKYVCGFK